MSAGTPLATYARNDDLYTVLQALEQSVIATQLPVSCSVSALSPTCSTPPGTAAPNCFTCRLTSSNRGRPCRIAPAVMSFLHVRPAKNGRHVYLKAVRVDCKKSRQNSVMPRPKSSRPVSVWMMDARNANC